MTRDELIHAIYNSTNVKKTDIKAMLDALASVTAQALAANDEIHLPGIGKLSVKRRAARIIPHPQTREPLQLPAKLGVHVTVSKLLKNAVNK